MFSHDLNRLFSALDQSMAIIEFDVSGTILKANKNFCDLMGYTEAEIVGKKHRIFLDAEYAASPAYKQFWDKLCGGEFECSEFKRIAKSGQEIYIRGNYNPIKNGSGKVLKIVKFANDITQTKMNAIDTSAKIDAISRAQAIIEFTPDGHILKANENFLSALGYTLSEVKDRHHSLFVDPAEAKSNEYAAFWSKLQNGEFVTGEFKRIGKDGDNVFIQASYNPVLSPEGKVIKVVKFATDVTSRVENVDTLGEGLSKLAEGDLAQAVTQPFIPSLDRLRTDFNAACQKLRTAMESVAVNTRAISAGSNEVKTSADDLAKRTEQQAASVEETAAALEEITTTVNDSSRRAQEAGELVSKTKAHAEHSGDIVKQAVTAMDQINDSSREISNIIGVIDEIAFQTNLLALNAGVEAARAGEAGKGFAVVAQEVRELAQRSAKAAKEIKNLITASGSQVANGVALVGKAGLALEEIGQSVNRVNADVSAIVEASREQSVALSEINRAINTVDQGTQQNAAMVEEQTAASHALASEADALFALLEQFNFGISNAPLKPIARSVSQRAPVRAGKPRIAVVGGLSTSAAAAQDWEEF